jgi:hypothetical protein
VVQERDDAGEMLEKINLDGSQPDRGQHTLCIGYLVRAPSTTTRDERLRAIKIGRRIRTNLWHVQDIDLEGLRSVQGILQARPQ